MEDEKKEQEYEYTCEETCFRDKTLYKPGDVMVTTKYKTAPKHFKGYDSDKDPDPKAIPEEEKPKEKAPAKKAPAKAKATPAKEPDPATKGEAQLPLDEATKE